MDIKSILVAVDGTAACEDRVKLAADLSDQFQARLIGCAGGAAPGHVGLLPLDPSLLSIPAVDETDHLKRAEALFRRIVGSRSSEWAAEQRPLNDVILAHAYKADLIVAGKVEAAGGSQQADPGVLLTEAGLPLLVAPPGRDRIRLQRMFVCWKNTRESRRALIDALPFLRRAEEVMIAQVARKADLQAACTRGGDLAQALSRHGLRAVSEVLLRDEHSTAELLDRRAALMGADLIIAGGRRRVGEQVFGGVTRSLLLTPSDKPVLMSH